MATDIPNLKTQKRVGLALGGGVARGPAHVGVLSVLLREGIPIDCVAGASAGAIVGATYCAGLSSNRIREIAIGMRWSRICSLVWPKRGLLSFDKLERLLVQELGDLTFADLPVPFGVAATDLETGEPVHIHAGSVVRAVRASASVPGFVVPVEMDGRLLGDGNFSNTIPVDLAREMGADYVIGVDIFKPALRHRLGAPGFLLAGIEILVQRAGGGITGADCLISPDLAGKSYVHFSKAAEYIALGEKAAEKKIGEIRAAITEQSANI